MGNGSPAVQSTLGMGDDVHLAAARFLHDASDPLRQLPSAVLHGCGGLLLPVVNCGAVALQFPGNAAPIIEEAVIPEKDAVDHQNGISGLADLAFRPGSIQFPLLRFKLRLLAGDSDDLGEIPDVFSYIGCVLIIAPAVIMFIIGNKKEKQEV